MLNTLSSTYLVYIALVMLITVLVARTLSKNGAIFLIDSFNGNETLAHSINHLLVVGFYLINIGFALLHLENRRPLNGLDEALVFLSSKLGFVLLVVGIAHFFNLFVISRFKSAHERQVPNADRMKNPAADRPSADVAEKKEGHDE